MKQQIFAYLLVEMEGSRMKERTELIAAPNLATATAYGDRELNKDRLPRGCREATPAEKERGLRNLQPIHNAK